MVRCHRMSCRGTGSDPEVAPRPRLQPVLPHQPFHSMFAASNSLLFQLPVHSGTAVAAPALLVHLTNLHEQFAIFPIPYALRGAPTVIAAARNPQYPAHRLHPKRLTV